MSPELAMDDERRIEDGRAIDPRREDRQRPTYPR